MNWHTEYLRWTRLLSYAIKVKDVGGERQCREKLAELKGKRK